MPLELLGHQKEALKLLRSGSILYGGVGSGKSITALAYYYTLECGGSLEPFTSMLQPRDLYIITTALKRDLFDWEKECTYFLLSSSRDLSIEGVKVHVDSWNNIGKYVGVKNAFFIFDEQRLIGSGAWVKSFLKISKSNHWLLLSATPGDTWADYIPVFIANGYYKNRSEFLREHVIYSRFTKYPKIDRYVNTAKLVELEKKVLVLMPYKKNTIPHNIDVKVGYDHASYSLVLKKRWNPYEKKPIKNITELCFVLRRITNSSRDRCNAIAEIFVKHGRVIIFYNFNYELDLLRDLAEELNAPVAEWNGHKHDPVPYSGKWMYLVQYTAGAEGWNCIETNAIIFYSQNYSYRIMHQAAGRIDRLNTKFIDLYYYHIKSEAKIDLAIANSLKNKKNFNEKDFFKF